MVDLLCDVGDQSTLKCLFCTISKMITMRKCTYTRCDLHILSVPGCNWRGQRGETPHRQAKCKNRAPSSLYFYFSVHLVFSQLFFWVFSGDL